MLEIVLVIFRNIECCLKTEGISLIKSEIVLAESEIVSVEFESVSMESENVSE
jgi:hypothetical protein